MPNLHNHAGWLAKRLSKTTACKEKKKEVKAAEKLISTKATRISGSSPSKLSLSNSFKFYLTTQVILYNAEAKHIIARVI